MPRATTAKGTEFVSVVTDTSAMRPEPGPRKKIAHSGVIGMLVFVATEIMFFAGLLSAVTITRATALMDIWPPPGQPRLPVEETLINTAALLLSGVLLGVAHFRFKKSPELVKAPLIASMLLGAAFVGLQGAEWVALIGQGLTLQSSAHGAFFYLIVGIHGLHALGAIGGLAFVLWRAQKGRLKASELYTAEVFWYFVVLLWPIIYGRLYF